MIPYFSTVAYTPEPEGWDAEAILQLVNPLTGKRSCPTLTKRNRRCENVVSQPRSIKVTSMVNLMSVEDAGVVARDHNRELTELAETMLCYLHSKDAEKVNGVVAQWKNCIKTSIRLQAQPRPLGRSMRAPAVEYQPTSASSPSVQSRRLNTLPEQATTVPEMQTRPRTVAFDTSSAPQSPAPSYGATFDRGALADMLHAFNTMTLQNQELKNQNQKLRDEKAQLMEEKNAAATEYKRAKSELEAVEEERNTFSDQVDELFREINTMRDRDDEHLETIAALEDTVQKTSMAYRRLKRVWTAASVVPKGQV